MNFLRRLALQVEKLDDSSLLGVVKIASVPDMLPSLFPLLVGLRIYQHRGKLWSVASCWLYSANTPEASYPRSDVRTGYGKLCCSHGEILTSLSA